MLKNIVKYKIDQCKVEAFFAESWKGWNTLLISETKLIHYVYQTWLDTISPMNVLN